MLLLLLCLLLTGETSLEWIARALLRSLDVIWRGLGHDILSPMGGHRITRHDVPGCDGVSWIWLPEGCVQGGGWAQVGWSLGGLAWEELATIFFLPSLAVSPTSVHCT